MFIHDALTGFVHEVPDTYGEVPVDGFGNPIGLVTPARPAPFAARPAMRFPARPFPRAVAPPGMVPAAPPPGWVAPAAPYAGPRPRRLYMRCSVWRGQPGLVPAAAQAVPVVTPTGTIVRRRVGGRRIVRRRR
jgi:hypothetical protein